MPTENISPFDPNFNPENLPKFIELCQWEEHETEFYDFKYSYFIPNYKLRYILDKYSSGKILKTEEKSFIHANIDFINELIIILEKYNSGSFVPSMTTPFHNVFKYSKEELVNIKTF